MYTISALATYASAIAIIPRADVGNTSTSSPFHDCLDSGRSWSDCRLAISTAYSDKKRDIATSTNLLYDCPNAGNNRVDCLDAVRVRSTIPGSEVEGNLDEQGFDTTVPAILTTRADLADFEKTLGRAEKCYSVNKLGGTGWLTNTAVKGLAPTACAFAVSQALTANTANAPPLGKYTRTGLSGYYMGGFGPIATPTVKFFLSVLFQGDYADLPVDLHQLGNDLCTQGVANLTSDPGCTAARKSGGRTEHTSVNGGEFHYAQNGSVAQFDNAGSCINCYFSMVLEAANAVDKDGSTTTPIDS